MYATKARSPPNPAAAVLPTTTSPSGIDCPPGALLSSSPFPLVAVVDDSTGNRAVGFGEAAAEKGRGEVDSGVRGLDDASRAPLSFPTSFGSETSPRRGALLAADVVSRDSASLSTTLGRKPPPHHDVPIVVVGYAFSEKKMSTMGVVMAEASRTKLPWPTFEAAGCREPSSDTDAADTSGAATCVSVSSASSSAVSQAHEAGGDDRFQMPGPVFVAQPHTGANAASVTSSLSRRIGPSNFHDKVVFSLQSGGYQTFSGLSRHPSLAGGNSTPTTLTTPLHHVVRCFRSSCSSIHDDDNDMHDESAFDGDTDSANSMYSVSSTTHGYGFGAGRVANGGGCAVSSSSGATQAQGRPDRRRRFSGSSSRSTSTTTYHRSSSALSTSLMVPARRIAFVPIDLDQPIEEQHGGRMDIILHKLTEDILCLSQLPDTPQAADGNDLTPSQLSALQRVRNLHDFSMKTGCCLLDHPDRVRTVMQRDTISSVLEGCLQDVASRSGVRVSTPKWTVVESPWSYDHIEQRIGATGLNYPIIVKPLIAAGMSASHAMAVVSNPTGLVRFVSSAEGDARPATEEDGCRFGSKFLCQEYSNHDEALYKVYVLGSHVSVHRRRSLPNLPSCHGAESGVDVVPTRLRDVVEFDSQRPYPRLSDFVAPIACDASGLGLEELSAQEASRRRGHRKKRPRHEWDAQQCESTGEALTTSDRTANGQHPADVTVEEVRPVVDAIRRAFGLDLFGFDVLVASPSMPSEAARWLVVDVNYFPSYKEVSNFPSLLAKYLTERALNDRSRGRLSTSHVQFDPNSFR